MHRTFQRAVTAICAMSLIACTSLQHLPENDSVGTSRAHRQAQNVKAGDTVRVNLKSAASIELVATAVTPDAIVGTHEGSPRTVQLIEVESIEQKRFDVIRTTLLVVGLALIALGQYAKGVSKLANQ
jgi:hypothetical protein